MFRGYSKLAFAAAVLALLTLSAKPSFAAYNTAGSVQNTTKAVLGTVASGAASTIVGGIGSGIAGGTFTTVGSLTPNGTTTLGGVQKGRLALSGTGASAGNGGNDTFGMWVNGTWMHLDNSSQNGNFNGSTWSGAVGADYKAMDRLIVGLAATGEDTRLRTPFNSGHLNTSGAGLGPYAAYQITENYVADVFGNYARLSNTTDRTSGAVTANYHSSRWIAGAGVTGRYSDGNWSFLPRAAYLFVRQSDDAYQESGPGAGPVAANTFQVQQSQLGGKIGYAWSQSLTPYLGARWEHNWQQPSVTIPTAQGASPSNSRDYAFVQFGLLASLSNSLSAGLEVNTRQRTDESDWGVTGNIRYSF